MTPRGRTLGVDRHRRRVAATRIASTLLGGGSNGYTISAITALAGDLDGSFSDGTPTTFAQEHLYVGACPP